MQLWDLAQRWQGGDAKARAELVAVVGEMREKGVVPFHWEIEFPEVFGEGFDASVGNPPFFWGNRISRFFGDEYRQWLLTAYDAANGNADLVVYFVRRCFQKARGGGTVGLVTTNSISESDTRSAGLDFITKSSGTIYAAIRDGEWPGKANVRVAHLFLIRGEYHGSYTLDGVTVANIGADLRERRSNWVAVKLRDRQGQSFKGVDFGGTGFLLERERRDDIIGASPMEADFIWPVLNASTFASSPSLLPQDFIINLTGMSLSEAESQAPECMRVVETNVLPKRKTDNRKAHRDRWWIYNETRPGLYAAISELPRVLVCPAVAKFVSFGFCHPRTVFTNTLNVFPSDSSIWFCILQSRVHEGWALKHSSSLHTRPRYNPTDCFETFPFPKDWESNHSLESAGQTYYDYRAALMLRNNEGLTKTYNRFHDPDETSAEILELRALHAAMDRAVLTAYGWHDLAERATCEFQLEYEEPEDDEDDEGRTRKKKKPWRDKWPQDFHDEVLARLLELNQQYAEEERLAGEATTPTPKQAGKKKSTAKKGAAKKATAKQTTAKKASKQTPKQVSLLDDE